MGAGEARPATPCLVAPTVDCRASFLAALAEYHAEGRHLELPADLLADPGEFARYVAALRADVDYPGEPVRYVAALRADVDYPGETVRYVAALRADVDYPGEPVRYVAALRADVDYPGETVRYVAALGGASEPAPWPDGYVPQSTYWWAAGGEYLGRLAIRHRLTPHLCVEGGHIGYEVRPAARRGGHATAMLAAALPLAAALGIELAHLDCGDDDVASRRVIEKNGGRLERREAGSLYFLVPSR